MEMKIGYWSNRIIKIAPSAAGNLVVKHKAEKRAMLFLSLV